MVRLSAVVWVGLAFGAGCGAGGGAGGSGGGGTGASGGAGGSGGEPHVCFEPPADPGAPPPEEVDFTAVGPLLAGEQILFNDWNAQPNELLTMRPDGTGEAVVFEAYRVWSFGVARSNLQIAFAAGDPLQEEHYGITLGDAIQPTFVFDLACGTVGALTWGNLNDECHTFGPGDDHIYLCRRYDFMPDNSSKGYRIARISVATRELEWLTPEDAANYRLSPQPAPDGASMLYYRIPVPTGTRSIVRAPIGAGGEEVVRDGAGYPRLSPDGSKVLVSDFTQGGRLLLVDLAGGPDTVVAEGEALSTAVFSPDGARVAFLRWEDASVCSHVEVARADGSQAGAPDRILDCASSGRFVTDLAWIAND